MQIEHISVSRYQCFDQCQLAYRYRYHLKLKPEGPEPEYFLYGTTVHRISEDYVENQGKFNIMECADRVLSGKVSLDRGGVQGEPIRLSQEYLKKLPEHLRSVEKITKDIGMEGHLEFPFKYDLDPPHNKLVVGFIDRLIFKKDKVIILDYKTTKKGPFRKTEKDITHDIQLRMYARVVQKEFNIPAKDIYAALYYLEGGNIVGARFSDKDILEAEQILLNAYDQIQNTPHENARPSIGYHCRRCDWKSICNAYKSSNLYKPN